MVSIFVELRNKTRGHGALTPAACSKYAPGLAASIKFMVENNPIFYLPWAYLHRNLSGKYRVVDLGGDQTSFASLKQAGATAGENLQDGVYFYAGKCRRVELIITDVDASDFFLPNGNFRGGKFELHSSITDNRQEGDATPYLSPAVERPSSETQGLGELELLNEVFSNIPQSAQSYVKRPKLEEEIYSLIMNDRHPIITLVGRGGIGKTSPVLEVLHRISSTNRYLIIFWFSARDIDLLASGAKPVQPRVLTGKDISQQYVAMLNEDLGSGAKKFSSDQVMAEHLRCSPHGSTLFVFDNFETVRNPIDLFQWIDLNIRLPNKAVITSRFRDFKADYPVEVSGMENDEAEKLAAQTVSRLNIQSFVSKDRQREVIEKADSHPYIMKIMFGEIATAGTFSRPTNLIARRDDILNALFERTFANLSPMATRIFLTLSSWRSFVPQLAIEAAVLRSGGDEGDPGAAVDQLVRMSLVEHSVADDQTSFLSVPLTSALFGRRKLEVAPNRAEVLNDRIFLQEIGSISSTGLNSGFSSRLNAYFRRTARKIFDGTVDLDEIKPVLEFLARGYPTGWLLLSQMERELGGNRSVENAAEYTRRFLETHPSPDDARAAWKQLVQLYQISRDAMGCCSALLEVADLSSPPLEEISAVANMLNNSERIIGNAEISDRATLLRPLAVLFERHLNEASATEMSRLAWLHLHCGNVDRAMEIAELGISLDDSNIHCQKLINRLRMGKD